MKNFVLTLFVLSVFVGAVSAFTNSLDNPAVEGVNLNNNFVTPTNPRLQNNQNNSYNPKEHTGFEHQDRNFKDPTMNDSRYNSNCQFGTCTPGGLNPNNK